MSQAQIVEPDVGTSAPEPILRAGDTCWRIERTGRLAVIIDAADYFRSVKAAALKARHSIMFIAWDFDTRITLDPEDAAPSSPNQLGELIKWIVRERPDVTVHILKWNLDIFKSLGRDPLSILWFDWQTGPRVRIRLDWAHPTGACHHQKVVVIDDAVAFCGGIDMTGDRWDTREHLDVDPRRVQPNGEPYEPWHDAATAVDGDAARALGELARERWRRATGERIDPPPVGGDPWPDGLRPTMRDVRVAIARTEPLWRSYPEINEIEALYLAAIGAARETIYLESQYFASRRIAEAIVARLSEAVPPEIVVINPLHSDGWLEEEAMDTARSRLLGWVHAADHAGRFRIYNPMTEAGQPIYVHAKIMIIDNRLLRVGSSNLNNRSMGYDTECDLAVETGSGAETGAEIQRFLDDLLAEHLGTGPERVEKARLGNGGSLIRAIEALRRITGRTLHPFVPRPINGLNMLISDAELLDPERPASLSMRLVDRVREARRWVGSRG